MGSNGTHTNRWSLFTRNIIIVPSHSSFPYLQHSRKVRKLKRLYQLKFQRPCAGWRVGIVLESTFDDSQPCIVLKSGHESIVNTIAFHPHLLHVVTAGVERRVVLHSPTPSSPCTQNLSLSPTTVRQLTDENSEQDSVAYMSALLGVHSTIPLAAVDVPSNADDDLDHEEQRTLSLFDQLSFFFF